jgi:TPR repeat protein
MTALIANLFIAASAVSGPFEDGLDAARRADYEAVLRLWRPLAAQGDAKAQTALGRLYAQGRGVLRDYAVAISWYRRAADQGDEEAEEALTRLNAGSHRQAAELSNIQDRKDRAENGGGSSEAAAIAKGQTSRQPDARHRLYEKPEVEHSAAAAAFVTRATSDVAVRKSSASPRRGAPSPVRMMRPAQTSRTHSTMTPKQSSLIKTGHLPR